VIAVGDEVRLRREPSEVYCERTLTEPVRSRIEADAIAWIECIKSCMLQSYSVQEDIGAAVVWFYESKSAVGAKKLHSSGGHFRPAPSAENPPRQWRR
jgi:hypothetical protein